MESIEQALKYHLINVYESTESESTELREAINSLSNSWDGIRKKTDSCLRAYSKAKEIPAIKVDIDTHVNKYFPKSSDNKSFSDLTLSEFIQLAHKNWQKLELTFNISSATWGKMLDEVREVRNKLVHFRGDISSAERHSLRFCSDWFTAHPVNQQEITVEEEPDTAPQKEKVDVSEHENTSTAPNKEAVDRAIKVKYLALANHLKNLDTSNKRGGFSMYINDIEAMTTGMLPRAAREQPTWWTEVSIHSQQWLETGWQIARAHLIAGNALITFSNWALVPHPIKEPWQFVYWCNRLGCTEQELRDAIKAVGSDSDLVEIHIKEEGKKRTN